MGDVAGSRLGRGTGSVAALLDRRHDHAGGRFTRTVLGGHVAGVDREKSAPRRQCRRVPHPDSAAGGVGADRAALDP